MIREVNIIISARPLNWWRGLIVIEISADSITDKILFVRHITKNKIKIITKYISQAKGFTSKELECGMKEIAEYDYMVKSGQMEDTYAVELIIMKYGRTLWQRIKERKL